MDPLVRASLGMQRLLAASSGTALAAGFGLALAAWSSDPPGWMLGGLVGAAFVASLVVRALRRARRLAPDEVFRLDLELALHAAVLAYLTVLLLPGALDGTGYALIYLLVMLVAAFARPGVTIATIGFALLLEAALGYASDPERGPERLIFHGGLLGAFAFMNMAVFRAEIARVRRLSRLRIEGEIERMKEAARSYRLLGAPSSALERGSVPPQDDLGRLLRSGVDEIHQAQQFALDLVKSSLRARSAVLLWLDSEARLNVREISTSDDSIMPGPFSAKDGLFAAALARGEAVSLSGPKTVHHLPYYGELREIGSACAVPLLEQGNARGVLVVDRDGAEPFGTEEQRLLTCATHFLLRAIENERVFVQLERAKIEQGKLYRAVDALAAASTEAKVIEACVSSARELAAFDFAAVTLFDRARGEHEVCAVSGGDSAALVGQRFRHNTGLVSMVVANRHPLPYRGDYDPSRQVVFSRRLAPPEMPALLVLPLLVHDRPLGTLVLGSRRRGAFGDAVRPTLEVLASHVAVSLANARMLARLEEMATTDGLTGLLNKRALSEAAVHKLRSAARFKTPLSVLVCDIDHFKRVNDTYGHDFGDVVIRGFGEVLKRAKRDTDVVGRFGGEEFIVVCEQTDCEGAALLAERIRAELEAAAFQAENTAVHVTCSVGVATFPSAGADWDSLFKATDEALYVSKRSGRNQVTVWSPRLGCAA
jgi:two-component system, cell cycle response regulator